MKNYVSVACTILLLSQSPIMFAAEKSCESSFASLLRPDVEHETITIEGFVSNLSPELQQALLDDREPLSPDLQVEFDEKVLGSVDFSKS